MGGHDVCHCKSLQGKKYKNLEFQALANLSNFARTQSSKVLQA
jgi:hypothetical protein